MDFQNKWHYPKSRKLITDKQLKAIWAAMDDPDFNVVNNQKLYFRSEDGVLPWGGCYTCQSTHLMSILKNGLHKKQ